VTRAGELGLPSYGPATVPGQHVALHQGQTASRDVATISMEESWRVWSAGSVWPGWKFFGVSLGEQTLPPFLGRGMPHLKCKRQLIINAPNQLHFVPDRT